MGVIMPRKAAPAKKLSYAAMITDAVTSLNSRKGCSQIALENYIISNYKKLDYKRHLLRGAIKRGLASGAFLVHHNHKNSIKLPAKSKTAKKTTTKKVVKKVVKRVVKKKKVTKKRKAPAKKK